MLQRRHRSGGQLHSRLARSSAFTLIEVLVVLLVVAVLVAISAPSFLGQTKKAHDSAAKQYLNYAFKAANAEAVAHEGRYTTGVYSADDLADAIQASEPELMAATGTCPDDATSDPTQIVVGAGTAGADIELCNDPTHTVWVLTATYPGRPSFEKLTDVATPPFDPLFAEELDPQADPQVVASASGSGQLRLPGGFRNFAFHAHLYSDGSVDGQAQLNNRDQGVKEHVAIDCLVIEGTHAWVSGTVTQSTSETHPVGAVGVFYVEDNGEGKKDPRDRISLFTRFAPELACDDAAAQAYTTGLAQPIDGGNVQVRPPAVPSP